jgi:hypothetical protein
MCRSLPVLDLAIGQSRPILPYACISGEERDVEPSFKPDEFIAVSRYLPDNERLVHRNGSESVRYVSDLNMTKPATNSPVHLRLTIDTSHCGF